MLYCRQEPYLFDRVKEHYHYDIGSSAAARLTKEAAQQATGYVDNNLSNVEIESKEAN
jgi:hypothetical protein